MLLVEMNVRDDSIQNDRNFALKGLREFDRFLPGNSASVVSASVAQFSVVDLQICLRSHTGHGRLLFFEYRSDIDIGVGNKA